MSNSYNEKSNNVTPEDISISKALYLDGIYVESKAIEQVVENAKFVGLISDNSGEDDDNHKWVVSMAKHHMLILKLQDVAKEKPFSPNGIASLDDYIKVTVRKVSKALADALMRIRPTIPRGVLV
ncbi:hypothetical protein [Vibrio aestuarianus]|uniref:Uncharacterized protein n=1 Tax=Vibrio aestuarianus TaxID=28171 RepID=A0ABN8TTD9_9VIBR|nr:hypothetical protein [Vibrio aestuarianus]MDE1215568.1 hypothetical protein [Vibrio aestuarianus]MDE1217575.1 hypothetical protein [Vibrio aestuarianus]MDE1229271.1 hypothetical protein [Vibrio aestuarianus]MDE1257313.1 hypothetical protein [Vibrio aestuarianus]MDE1262682.1 hypothetical protein [Vibrio aestuarianus]